MEEAEAEGASGVGTPPWVDRLQDVYSQTSAAHTSLVSKLAQHNGLVQFAADFGGRVPPLELRMVLPEVQASIRQLLATLGLLQRDLQALQIDPGSLDVKLRDALAQHLDSIITRRGPEFQEQEERLGLLSAASPLTSPIVPERMLARLAAKASASSSPTGSSRTPSASGSPWMSSCSTSPQSPDLTPLPPSMACKLSGEKLRALDEFSEEEDQVTDAKQGNGHPNAFKACFGVELVIHNEWSPEPVKHEAKVREPEYGGTLV